MSSSQFLGAVGTKRVAASVPPSVIGVRPKARLLAPAALQPRSFRHAMGSMQMPGKPVQGAKLDKWELFLLTSSRLR